MKKKLLNISTIGAVILTATAMIAAPRSQAQSSMQHHANSTATPAQVVDQLLGIVESELVPLAEAMPADKYNFAPSNGDFKGVRNFGAQLRHVIQANNHMFANAASIQPPSTPKMDELKTKVQIVEALKDSFAFGHRAIATLNAENALETVSPADGVNTRAGVMLFAIIHTNDHYGQLVEYLRMNGIVPPSSRRSGNK